MFKLKPQKNSQDGSFLLVIECGAESSSMSIKVWSRSLVQELLFFVAAGPFVISSGTVASLVLCCVGSVRYSRVELGFGWFVALE